MPSYQWVTTEVHLRLWEKIVGEAGGCGTAHLGLCWYWRLIFGKRAKRKWLIYLQYVTRLVKGVSCSLKDTASGQCGRDCVGNLLPGL